MIIYIEVITLGQLTCAIFLHNKQPKFNHYYFRSKINVFRKEICILTLNIHIPLLLHFWISCLHCSSSGGIPEAKYMSVAVASDSEQSIFQRSNIIQYIGARYLFLQYWWQNKCFQNNQLRFRHTIVWSLFLLEV